MIILLLGFFFNQSTWTGGPGQSFWVDTTRYYTGKNINYNIPGVITISQKEHFYNEVDTLQTTNSTSFVNALTLSFTPSDTGNFLIIVSAQLGTQAVGTTDFAEVRIFLDTILIGEQRMYRQNSGVLDERSVGTFILKNLSPNLHQIIVQYRTSSSSYLAGIRNVRITVNQTDRYYYAESESLSQTNNTSFVEKLSLSFNKSLSESCLILSIAEIGSNANGGTVNARLLMDGNQMSIPETKYIISQNQFYPFWVSRGISVSAGNHTLSLQYETSNSSNMANIRKARIVVLPKKDIESISTSESERLSSSRGTKIKRKLRYNFTPSKAGDYIIIAQAYLMALEGAEARLLIDGANNGYERFYRWAISEWLPFFLIKKVYFTNEKHKIEIQYRGLGGKRTITSIQNARIIIIPASTFHNIGTLISSAYDSGVYGETRWLRMYSDAVIPSGTEVKIQVAGNNDSTTWNYIGPDGTDTTYFDTIPGKLDSILYGDRYLRYKIFLIRDTINFTDSMPELTDINFLYFKDYYVDEPEGNDTNYGKSNNPFLTINRAVNLMYGSDRCIARTGTYPESIFIKPNLSGIDSFPTIFMADTNATPEVLSYSSQFAFFDSAANYVNIQGFDIRGAYIVNIYSLNSRHLNLYQNRIYIPDGSYGILLENVDSAAVKANTAIPDTGSSWPYESIWLWNSTNVDVDSNTIYGMSDDGTSAWYSNNITFTRNLIHNIYVAGILFYQSGACNVYNNTIDTCESGVYSLRASGVITTLNNSITNCKYGFYWLDGVGFVSSDYNNLWNNTSNYTASSGQTVTQGANDISADPLYNPDYTLSAGSPNIDAGTDVGLPYAGTAPDIGAYEYGMAKAGKSKNQDIYVRDRQRKDTKIVRITSDNAGSFLNISEGKDICIIGNNLYIVFADDSSGNYEIYLATIDLSSNNILSIKKISASNNLAYFPTISHSGDILYIFWADRRTGEYQIYMRKSTDAGNTWQNEKLICSGSSPSVSVYGGALHLLFRKRIGDSTSTTYIRSKDGGNIWDTEIGISDTSICLSPKITSIGDYLYAVWEENKQIYFSHSTNGGDDWTLPIPLSNPQHIAGSPDIGIFKNEIWVLWQEIGNSASRIAFRKSTDNGSHWADEVLITPNNEYYFHPNISFNGNEKVVAISRYENPWNSDIYITRSNDGVRWTEASPVFSENGLSEYPHLLVNNGKYYLTWWDNTDGNPEVYYAVLDKDWQTVLKRKIIPSKFEVKVKLVQSRVRLHFALPDAAYISVDVFDILGRKVLSPLKYKHLSSGNHNIYFSIKGFPSGIYFLRIGVSHQKSKTLLTKKIFYLH